MFKASTLAAALVLAAVVPAHAGINLNSFGLNGIALNGFTVNGMSINGISVNGMSVNGMSINGVDLDGRGTTGDRSAVAAKARDGQAGGMRAVAVEVTPGQIVLPE